MIKTNKFNKTQTICGGSRGGNNRGRSSGNNYNSFSSLDQSDRFYTKDTSNNFYLSNSDHLGLSLVSTQLIGSNYNSWNRVMCIALIAKNKIGFVHGTIDKLEDDDHLLFFWFCCNNMVMSWILNVVTKNITDSIMYISNACDIWNDLLERFH
ncbi:hypothetical protein UlMin_009560 [Ulmus minor]